MTPNEAYYSAKADVARSLRTTRMPAERRYCAATIATDIVLPPRGALRRLTAPGLSAGLVSRALAREERRAKAQALLARLPWAARQRAGAFAAVLATRPGVPVGLSDALRAEDSGNLAHAAACAVASLLRDARGAIG